MFASTLRKLAALLFVVVPLVPLAGLFGEPHHCACGMSKDACFCELLAAQTGAHCDMAGRRSCSMRPARDVSGVALLASIDLRGWVRSEVSPRAMELPSPSGSAPLLDLRAPRSFSRPPESPPPQSLPSV